MKREKKLYKHFIIIFSGMIVGIINGLLGGGGGMLVVPLIEKYIVNDNKKAHATAIAVILPLCVVSSIIYSIYNNPFNLDLVYIVCGSVVGSVVGSVFLKKLSGKWVRLLFAAIIFAVAVRMLLK